MKYRQLTLDERYQISTLRKQDIETAEIARRLGRHRSTIGRELARNARKFERDGDVVVQYHPPHAQHQAAQRRVAKGARARRIQGALQEIVELKLRQAWTPEEISGRLRLEGHATVCTETIYQHVLRDALERRSGLRYCLRFGGYKHPRLRKSKHALKTREGKLSLADRPEAANRRTELGHWERDCMLGTRGTSALLTIVDRKSRYARIRWLPKVNAAHAEQGTADALRPLGLVRTITNDNGPEFQRPRGLEPQLDAPIYFCDPSSPWQRGSVENFNGLLRYFLPKNTCLDNLPPWAPRALEDTLNHRPRKTLGFRTPHEVFFSTRMELLSSSLRLGLESTIRT